MYTAVNSSTFFLFSDDTRVIVYIVRTNVMLYGETFGFFFRFPIRRRGDSVWCLSSSSSRAHAPDHLISTSVRYDIIIIINVVRSRVHVNTRYRGRIRFTGRPFSE